MQSYATTRSLFLVTGCINPDSLDRLNADDDGGQYDSNGGPDGEGNPQGSMCLGWVFSDFERI